MDCLNLKIDLNGLQSLIEAKLMLIKFYQISGEYYKNYEINKVVRDNNSVKFIMDRRMNFLLMTKLFLHHMLMKV